MSWTSSPYTAPPLTPPDPGTIAYATPASHGTGGSARVWAGVAIVFAGLVLILLGGCFLIGVMMVTTNGLSIAGGPPTLPGRAVALLVVLYALAFASFGAAVFLLVMGVRGLYLMLRG
jgi:hypothetical protein